MSFVKREMPPPNVKEGETLEAKILDIEFPVESGFKTKEGKPQYQVKFTLELDNGYQTPSWIRYYERPSERSTLGALCLAFVDKIGKDPGDVPKTLNALKEYGRIFVQVPNKDGFREWNGKLYPKFKVMPFKLPEATEKTPSQATQPLAPPVEKEEKKTPKPAVEGVSEETARYIKESKNMLEMGLPMNESDWNGLPVATRAELLKHKFVETKVDAETEKKMYYFTQATKPFFHEEQ